jgi:AraC family transcriptional regulator of adaptative response / DNA-3-methyladenine glycosylase II
LLLRLPFRGALDWGATVAYFAARAIPGIEHVSDLTYRRTIRIGDDSGVLELFQGGSDHLLLRAHLPHWEELIHIVERARRIANLDLDLEEPTHILAADPLVGPLLLARPGLRPPGTWDAFETGVRAIIGQQISNAAANTMIGRLVDRVGDPVGGLRRLGLTHTFPSPEALADSDLSGVGLTGARAAAIRAFARAVAAGTVRLDRSVSLDRLIASIIAVAGLGPWTAQYLALRLGEPDACPTTDLGLRRALPRLARQSTGPLAEVAEGWRPWRAVAATYLWMADALPQAPLARVGAA